MKSDNNDYKIPAVRKLLSEFVGGERVALLTTVSKDGCPHATWMGTLGLLAQNELLTITSPDSEKVRNLRANPNVEWLFTSDDQHDLIYLKGTAEVLAEPSAIKTAWTSVNNLQRAFFLKYFNSGIGIAVVKTTVESVTHCVPMENRKEDFDSKDVWPKEET